MIEIKLDGICDISACVEMISFRVLLVVEMKSMSKMTINNVTTEAAWNSDECRNSSFFMNVFEKVGIRQNHVFLANQEYGWKDLLVHLKLNKIWWKADQVSCEKS